MQWSALLIASEAPLRETGVLRRPGTMSVCVLTLTYWILWQHGRSAVDFTFRQSCVAPACFYMLRTSPLDQVCLKRAKVAKLALAFVTHNVSSLLRSNSKHRHDSYLKICHSRWACSMGLPLWPPLSAATLALSRFCSSGPQAGKCPNHWLWLSETGRLWAATWVKKEEYSASRRKRERWCSRGRS